MAALATAAPVSYESKGVRAPVVIAELAAAANLQLSVSMEFANEPLTVSVSQVEAEELLERIAAVLGGTWRMERNGTRRLIPAAAKVSQERRQIEAAKLDKIGKLRAKIAASMQQRLTALPGAPAPGDGSVSRAQLILGIPAATLASIAPYERIVFSTSPNPMQRALPVPADVWLAVAKSMSESASARSADAGEPKTDDERKLEEFEDFFTPSFERRPWSGAPAEMHLIVSARAGELTAEWTQPSFEIRAYDAAGALLDSDMMYLASLTRPLPGPDREPAVEVPVPEELGGEPTRSGARDSPKTPITYSADSTAIHDLMVSGQVEAKLREELVAKMRRVDAHDPLGYGYGEALLAVAKAHGKALVACLPDDPFEVAELPQTVERFLDMVKAADAIVWEDSGDWRLVRPKYPELTRKSRVDRQALASALEATGARDVLTLDMRAALAAALVREPSWSWRKWIAAICPNFLAQGVFESADWTALRLWGLLTKGQRDAIREGRAVPAGSLEGEARTLARRMVYGSRAKLVVDRQEKWPNIDPVLIDVASNIRTPAPKDVQDEPTELLPGGLPSMASLSAIVNREPVFAVGASEGARRLGLTAAGLFEVAAMRAMRSAGVDGPEDVPSLTRARQGVRSEIVFRLVVSSAVHVRHVLTDDDVPNDAPMVEMSKLPPDIEQRLRKIEAVLMDLFRLISAQDSARGSEPPERP